MKPITTNDTQLKPLIEEAIGILSMTIPIGSHTLNALFSGGKDSMVSTHIAATYFDQFDGVAYVNTNTGIISHEHAAHVAKLANNHNWQMVTASPSTTYEMLVIKEGFPGPASHSWMYRMLKERSIRKISTTLRKGKPRGTSIVYVTGIRRAESQQRANVPEYTSKTKTETWVNPLVNWPNEAVKNYLDLHQLSVPNYKYSLDCGCGAYAQPHERDLMMEHPQQKIYIMGLEGMVRQSRQLQQLHAEAGYGDGRVIPEAFCQWGHGLNGQAIKSPKPGGVSICNDCVGRLNQDGNVGVDPDQELIRARDEEVAA